MIDLYNTFINNAVKKEIAEIICLDENGFSGVINIYELIMHLGRIEAIKNGSFVNIPHLKLHVYYEDNDIKFIQAIGWNLYLMKR